MKILVEEYGYAANDERVQRVLKGLDSLQDVEGKIQLGYVGYFYNSIENDCVFILPKVIVDEGNKVFGVFAPEDLIDFEKAEGPSIEQKKFIYEFVVWIYRAIAVYNDQNAGNHIIYHKYVTSMGNRQKSHSHTFLDVLLSLLRFNQENQNFITFTLKNLHAGFNKINWTRTIAHSQAIIHGGEVAYLIPVNKKRMVNFDEELFIIYFSILNYVHETYGFPISIMPGFELIKGAKFKRYLDGFGKTQLRQIKYKYFSDKALQLWELCYAFFDSTHNIRINTDKKEYLLAKNFNIVFEAMIDELIGDKRDILPSGLKDQADGKRVDHMYRYKGLIENDDDNKPIYYIGDSKYYKIGNKVTAESVYKQYTYARNVIQWNLNLFLNGDEGEEPRLRDDLTEGYNIIPNFFISARIDKNLSYAEKLENANEGGVPYSSRQFNNRLFDRDTLLISYYNVNFLHVLSLYARNSGSQKAEWKEEVRKTFRKEITAVLQSQYDFYAMKPIQEGVDETYIHTHFQEVLGKIYRPFEKKDQKYYSLAIDKKTDTAEKEQILKDLSRAFIIGECNLGADMAKALRGKTVGAVQGIAGGVSANCLSIPVGVAEKFKEGNFKSIAMGLLAEQAIELLNRVGTSIKYILVHYNSDKNASLRKVKGSPRLVLINTCGADTFMTFKTHDSTANDIALLFDLEDDYVDTDFSLIKPILPNKGGTSERYLPYPFYLDESMVSKKVK